MSLSKKVREYCLSKGWKEIGYNNDVTSRHGQHIDLTVEVPDKEQPDNSFRLYIFIPRSKSDLFINLDTGIKKSQLSLETVQTISHVLPNSYVLHHDTVRYLLRTSAPYTEEDIQNLENILEPMLVVARVLQKIVSDMQDHGDKLAEKYASDLRSNLTK